MSLADELLASIDEEVSIHEHIVSDPDNYFVIDPDTREIENLSRVDITLMQFDHNSEVYTFEVPRYVENHDMLLCNRVRVHYLNVDGETGDSHADLVEMSDLHIDPDNEDAVICTWTISRRATQLAGVLNFLVQYMCVSDSGTVDYEWHSDTYDAVTIKKSINNGEVAVIEYSDIVEQWRTKLFGAGNSTIAEITLNAETQLANVRTEGASQVAAVSAEGESKLAAIVKAGEDNLAVIDEAGESNLSEIKKTSDSAISAVKSKGEETLATIPADYTTTYNMANDALRTRANAIVITQEGESIVANDCSDDYLRGLKLYGKTTQKTTTGAQLLNYGAWKQVYIYRGTAVFENNGITLTATGDDCFTVHGEGNFPENAKIPITEGETITISWEESSNAVGLIYIFPNGESSGMVNASNSTVKQISYTATSGITFVTFRFGVQYANDTIAYKNIMINKGSAPLAYEPYTGGKASPNPNYPQEIESIENPIVTVCGKNLWDHKHDHQDMSSIDGWGNTLWGNTATRKMLKSNTTYTMSFDVTCLSVPEYESVFSDSYGFALYPTNDPTKHTIMVMKTGEGAFKAGETRHAEGTFTTPSGVEDPANGFLILRYTQRFITADGTAVYATVKFDNVQIEIGSEATEYEDYCGADIHGSYTLPGIPVTTGGNCIDSNGQQWICDEIDFERGVYVRRIFNETFMDFSNAINYSYDGQGTSCALAVGVQLTPMMGMCSHLPLTTNTTGNNRFNPIDGVIYFKLDGEYTFEDLKAKLTEMSPIVIARLATPIETPLTDEELFNFSQLHSNYLTTTVLNDSNVKMEVKYNADTQTYFDNSRGASDEQVERYVDVWLTKYFASAEEVSF